MPATTTPAIQADPPPTAVTLLKTTCKTGESHRKQKRTQKRHVFLDELNRTERAFYLLPPPPPRPLPLLAHNAKKKGSRFSGTKIQTSFGKNTRRVFSSACAASSPGSSPLAAATTSNTWANAHIRVLGGVGGVGSRIGQRRTAIRVAKRCGMTPQTKQAINSAICHRTYGGST